MKIKEKAVEVKKVSGRVLVNLEEMLNAIALSAVVGFTGYTAYQHRSESILWQLLGLTAVWSMFQAFRAWTKVLNK